ncbi:MAG: DUF3006 domain-containing protein [Myxococcota bacterium]|nr:DUF3006 domain-containing protein [Myxococcota bacterium]
MRIVIDRIEGAIAVLDVDGEIIDFPLAAMPEGAKEGSVLQFGIVSDKQIRAAAAARLERLRARSQDDEDEVEL